MSVNKNLLVLHSDKLPDCWKDETRMNVLFSPVRNQSVNPQDWDSKLSFWSNLIYNSCVNCQIYTFKVDDLKRVFNVDGRIPSCLLAVIEQMYKSGEIKPATEFLQKPAETWSRWAADVFIKKPIVWSYSKVKSTFVSPNISELTFVHLGAVQTNAEKLIVTLSDKYKNKVLNLQDLLSITDSDPCKVDDFKLVLHHLVCKGKADIKIVKDDSQEISLQNFLIKLTDKNIKPISDTEVNIHILEQNEKTLSKTVESLEEQVDKHVTEAKSYLRKGQRQLAKGSLRKKHEIESRLVKRSNALQNIQVLLLKMQDVDSDSYVLDSYKTALASLKKSFKDNNLSEDSVADTMTDIADILDEHEEIQASLARPISEKNDEEELEAELAELLENNDDNAPVEPTPVEDQETIALQKRLEILKLPVSSQVMPVLDQNL